jgi:hypothetical protein
MMRMFVSTAVAVAAVIGVSALAYAEEVIIQKETTVETQPGSVEVQVVPAPEPPRQRVVEEHTVTKEVPAVQRRTDTVVTTTTDKDDDE